MNASSYDEDEIEDALRFLFSKKPTREKSKPFALHSVRVASILWSNDAPRDAVLAAVLHDLIEDTDTNASEIENRYGVEIAKIVEISTVEKETDDYEARLINISKSIDDAVAYGLNAVLVRAADMIDNSNYYKLAGSKELSDYLYEKYVYFLDATETTLKESFIWPLLKEAYTINVKPLKD